MVHSSSSSRRIVSVHSQFKVIVCVAYLLCCLLLSEFNFVVGREVELNIHNTSHPSLSNINFGKDTSFVKQSCDSVKNFFDTTNITINPDYLNRGTICGGYCCNIETEEHLSQKSAQNFEKLLRHHTKSLRGILETTAGSFKNHILELSYQSENKTLNVFSQVYRRMLPLSRQLIQDLYAKIRGYISKSTTDFSLDVMTHKFFVNLFPVAYHHAVHLHNNSETGDLQNDYISCLQHTFNDLKPFGDIPALLGNDLDQSINAANVFITSLERGAQILASTDQLDSDHLTERCQAHLLKMTYCPQCNGIAKKQTKSCYGYCLNVMRGCLAQYVGILDIPWSNFAEAIENLVQTSIQSENGIVFIIKGLDAKLSEAIMRAMEDGPELEKKVRKTCGMPKLLPSKSQIIEATQQSIIKWATPPDAELLSFLSTVTKSRDFYSKIVDNICEDSEFQRKDRLCWTGDRIGDYTQTIMSTGVDAQRYNPEVPLLQNSYTRASKLNELVDKLIKLRSQIVNSIPSNSRIYSDIQSDMAHHDEEGSGGLKDDFDDDEYNNIHGSGDNASGDGPTSTPAYVPISPKTQEQNSSQSRYTTTGFSKYLHVLTIMVIIATVH